PERRRATPPRDRPLLDPIPHGTVLITEPHAAAIRASPGVGARGRGPPGMRRAKPGDVAPDRAAGTAATPSGPGARRTALTFDDPDEADHEPTRGPADAGRCTRGDLRRPRALRLRARRGSGCPRATGHGRAGRTDLRERPGADRARVPGLHPVDPPRPLGRDRVRLRR